MNPEQETELPSYLEYHCRHCRMFFRARNQHTEIGCAARAADKARALEHENSELRKRMIGMLVGASISTLTVVAAVLNEGGWWT